MPATACRKKRVTGRYQLQFPLVWVQDQLQGKTAERWRAEILRAFRAASPGLRSEWRASFASQKGVMMKKTLTVDNRSGRRFDREAYCVEAQQVYGEDEVPTDASPKLLARCFQHSVDFIVSKGLVHSLSGALSPAASSIAACASASTEDSSDVVDEQMTEKAAIKDVAEQGEDLLRVSPSSDAEHVHSASAEHTEHTFSAASHKSTCFTELSAPLAAPESALADASGRVVGDSDCLLGMGEDELMGVGLFDEDDLPDLLADPMWDTLQKCEPMCLYDESNMCSSVVPVLEGSCSRCTAQLAETRQQRDDALRRCAYLQSQVERLRIERDALWGSSDDCFSLDGCFSR